MILSAPLCTAMLSLAAVPLLAFPALAHDGVHLHPHGLSGWLILAALAGLGVGYLLPMLRGRG